MTWRPEVPADFQGETGKIRWRALPYCTGSGLDIGCGPWKVAPHAIGIDGAAAPGAGGPSLVMDCTDLSVFSTNHFDFVFSSHFLEHVEDTAGVLWEFWRIVKPGGHLVLYLPHKEFYPNIGQYGANPDHKHDLIPADVIGHMKKAKHGGWDLLENEERSHDYEYSFFQVFRKRVDAQHLQPWQNPKPAKTAAIARPGNFGDAIWCTSIARQLKLQGYHVTAYVEATGQHVMKENPDIDRVIAFDRRMFYEPGQMFQFLDAERPRYDKFVNFTQSIESTVLLTPDQPAYHWPKDVRDKHCNRNYAEWMHEVAEVPYELAQRVVASKAETQFAIKERAKITGRVIVLANSGSTAPKWWPYAPAFCVIMASLGVHVYVVGDLKGLQYAKSDFTHVIPIEQWTMREAIAFAKIADAVIGQETGLLNAVAIEPVPKIVMLGHSTVENLTRDWTNTESLVGQVPCYPCHQIHYTHAVCPTEKRSGAAACQAEIKIEHVVEALIRQGVLSVADREQLMQPQPITIHRKAA